MLFIPSPPRPFLHEHLWRSGPEFWCCNSITESSSLRISPCVKSPHPPHEEPSVWEATGQVALNQHFKAAPLSIIRGWAASSLLTWVSLGYGDVRSTCAASEGDITLLGNPLADVHAERKQHKGSSFLHLPFPISLVALPQKSSSP